MSGGIDRRSVMGGASAAAIMALLRCAPAATGAPRAPAALDTGGRRAFAANQTITALVPDRLYRVGCAVRAERLSWLPGDLDAWEPLNSYVLVDRDHCVFVDLGMPIARPAMESALETLVGDRKAWLHYTRNEYDCIGNMGLVLGTCRNPTLLFGSAGGILEWINDPAVSIMEVRDFLGRIPIEEAKNDTSRSLGELRLDFLQGAVRQMLITQWVYEETSGCLFTSDFFGFRHAKDADAPPIVDSARNLPPVEVVAREIVARMNWMREARYPGTIERLEALFTKYDVRMIAPVHGCVIVGREAVAAHLKLAVKALRMAGSLPDEERLRYV
jgi:flavorubredoxin